MGFGWGGAGSLGRAGQAEADHDGIAIDLDAFDACLYAVGQQVSIPVENLAAVGADSGPLHPGVQERPQQRQVVVSVGRSEVPGDVVEHPGAG